MRPPMSPLPFYPLRLAGKPAETGLRLEVLDKFTGEPAAAVAMAGPAQIEAAIAAAEAAAPAMRALAAYERRDILLHCVRTFESRAAELAELLCAEGGKPIRDSRAEVGRLIETFRFAAEESTRIGGEVLPLDASPRARGYSGLTRRFPVGPCSFISPFNFPLNLAAHKIAPAIAAGCPFVLKPASSTPVSALVIGEALAAAGMPEGSFSILPCPRDGADLLCTDPRIKLLSFTGSPEAGWRLKERAGKKKVVLELGGNAACVVDEGTNLDDAAARITLGAFFQSGQSCISVQRVIAHDSLYDPLRELLVEKAKALPAGDPRDEATVAGPLIALKEAERVERWIASARARGARLLCGGGRKGPVVEPAILENVPRDEPLVADEVFGPVFVLSRFTDFDAALAEVNDGPYGLQAGVFTRDLYRAQRAFERIEAGGVVIGDIPSWRTDQMPYGGVKDSGFGREGIRWAIEDMTELKLMVIRRPPGD